MGKIIERRTPNYCQFSLLSTLHVVSNETHVYKRDVYGPYIIDELFIVTDNIRSRTTPQQTHSFLVFYEQNVC